MGATRIMPSMLLSGALLLACNALSGISELAAEDTPETGPPTFSPPDAGGFDGGGEAKKDPPAPPPTCACMPRAPDGWSALSLILERDGGSPAECPTGLVPTMVGGQEPSGGGCSPCTCGTPTGACTTALVRASFGDCTNACFGNAAQVKAVTASCTELSYCGPSSAASAVMATDGGSCVASGGKVTASAFSQSGTTCTFAMPPNGSCAEGQACAPKSEGAQGSPTCIVRTGTHECPANSVYTERKLYYAGIEDKRACAACTCGTPQTSCSTATIGLYAGNNCENQVDTVTTAANTCAQFTVGGGNGSAKILSPSTLLMGSCAPSGGNQTGAVAPKDPSTVCCTK